MPNDMSKENEVFKVGGMPVASARSNEVFIPESAKAITGIVSGPGRTYEIGSQIRMQLDPNDPNFQLEMARRSGLYGSERMYERDPFGLYSASSNFLESLLRHDRQPEEGSPVFNAMIVRLAKKEEIGTEDAEKILKDELKDSRENVERSFRLAIASGNRSINETISMLEAFVPPKPFEANMQERHLTEGKQALEAMAVYFDGKVPEKISGWYRVYDAINEQQIGLFNILCSVGGSLEGYYDALAQAGNTLLSRSTYHASIADFRAAYTVNNPGVSNIELSDQAKVNIKDTLASKEIHELSVEMLSQARRLILFNAEVSQWDVDKPDGEEGFMRDKDADKKIKDRMVQRLEKRKVEYEAEKNDKGAKNVQKRIDTIKKSPFVVERKIQELQARKAALPPDKVVEAARLQRHIDSLTETLNLNFGNHREFMKLVFGTNNEGKIRWILTARRDNDGNVVKEGGTVIRIEVFKKDDGKWYQKIKAKDAGGNDVYNDVEVKIEKGDYLSPTEILTWFGASDKLGDRDEWIARMLAMLTWKENGKSLSAFLESASEAEIKRVAEEILKNAADIRANMGDKIMNSKPEFAAAKIALLSWIEKDKGFQFSGSLAPNFVYKNEINGKKLVDEDGNERWERLNDAGGIYKSFDSVNLYAYWRRLVTYKRGIKSATTFFTAMSDGWGREVSKHGPDWLPALTEISKNPKIQRIHDRFFKDTPETILWRARRLTGNNNLTEDGMKKLIDNGTLKEAKIDDVVKDHLLENGFTYMTVYGVPVPIYLPKNFKLTPWETMVDKKTKETVMDLFHAGIMPKDIDWDVYNYEALGRHWVSMSMLNKFAHLFVDTYDTQRDGDYQKFFNEPGPQSIAEMAKRVYLAFRDLPEGYQQYIPSIVPFMIAQNAYDTIMSSTDIGAPDAKERIVKQWNYAMSQWIRAAMWIPQVVLDDEQLYNGANADMQSMRNDMALMIMYYKHIFEKVIQAAFKADNGKLHAYFDDQMSLYGSMEELAADKGSGEAEWSFGPPKIPLNWLVGEKRIGAELFGERH